MFHPDFDPEAYKAAYAIDNRVRINNILAPEKAAQLNHHLQNGVDYALSVAPYGKGQSLSQKDLAALSEDDRVRLQTDIYTAACRGVGFCYDAKTILGSGDAMLNGFLDFLNSHESIAAMRAITGMQDIAYADGQATRYLGNHFLTRHRDDPEGQTRRLAYVFSFTPVWHPDWGGLLMFYEESGAPRDAWSPELNTLSIFDVRHIHAVTLVAPFAGGPRLSITGWFRA